MVNRGAAVSIRPGVTLVEVIVALTLFAVGALGAVATQSVAARLLREAEARADAVVFAGNILDSLLTVPIPTGGVRDDGRYRASWSAVGRGAGTRIELEVEYESAGGSRKLHFEMLQLPPLPRVAEDG